MGNLFVNCCGPETTNIQRINIQYQGLYQPVLDKFIAKEEIEYINLKQMGFIQYCNYLGKLRMPDNITVHYSVSNEDFEFSSSVDEEYKIHYTKEDFGTFLEYKILYHQNLYAWMVENEVKAEIMKTILLEIYDKVSKKDKAKCIDRIQGKKYLGYAIGFIYCGDKNQNYFDKILFLYKMFEVEGFVYRDNIKLITFLRAVLYTPSLGYLYARYKIQTGYPNNIPNLEMNIFKAILDCMEEIDYDRILGIFMTSLFENKDKLSWDEMLYKFKTKNNLRWIFFPSGIRLYLEENNNDKGERDIFRYLKDKPSLAKQFLNKVGGAAKDGTKGIGDLVKAGAKGVGKIVVTGAKGMIGVVETAKNLIVGKKNDEQIIDNGGEDKKEEDKKVEDKKEEDKKEEDKKEEDKKNNEEEKNAENEDTNNNENNKIEESKNEIKPLPMLGDII